MLGIELPPDVKVFVVHGAIDWRCGIDRIVALCETTLKKDASRDGLFMFRNRHSNAVKILFYDGNGYWLFMKRLSKSLFKDWPKENEPMSEQTMNDIVEILKPKVPKQQSTLSWLKIT